MLRAIHQEQVATAQARQAQQLTDVVRRRHAQVAAALLDEPPRRQPVNAEEAAQPNRTPLIGRPYDQPVPGTVAAPADTSTARPDGRAIGATERGIER